MKNVYRRFIDIKLKMCFKAPEWVFKIILMDYFMCEINLASHDLEHVKVM